MSLRSASRRAFSLIELVIVVVIIGIIAAIAVPRMSRGAQGATDSSLVSTLATLRNAIDLYQTEHGGSYPLATKFDVQMTTFTDDAGGDNPTKTSVYYLGPYLRSVPALPVGPNKNSTGVAAAPNTGIGWIYDQATGKISANSGGQKDSKNVDYNLY
jgi:prepilin-type N-terminal cleavage/methylation domain-containing protein